MQYLEEEAVPQPYDNSWIVLLMSKDHFANQHTQVFNIANPLQIDSIAHSHILAQSAIHDHRQFWKKKLYFVYCRNQFQNMSSKMPKVHLVARCSVSKHVCISMLKHKRVVASPVERLTSGAFQAPMLVVSFYLCHCSLICFSDFLVILSAIYQRKEKTRKWKKKSCFFALWPMSTFLKEDVLCVFSFCAVKNELVVYWKLSNLFVV